VPISIRARSAKGPLITDLGGWEAHASTPGKWRDHFSAKELARLWLSGDGQRAVTDALAPVIPGLQITQAIAEAQTSFDAYPGGVRNHDVLAFGNSGIGEVVVGVEGKVNESLDASINRKYEAARQIKHPPPESGKKPANTNLDKRVDGLLDALLGKRVADAPAVGALRYQLFSALAGTVAAATAATEAAALVVHLVETPLADQKKFEQTRQAIEAFAEAAGLDPTAAIVGPISLKKPIGQAKRGMSLWLTAIRTGPAPGPGSAATARSAAHSGDDEL
jgi:hypothetical protein